MIVSTFAYALSQRIPLRVDVLRDRARLYRMTSDGLIENTYTLKVMNLDQHPHEYRVTASGLDDLTLVAPPQLRVEPGAILDVPVSLQAPPDELHQQSYTVRFDIRSTDQAGVAVQEKSRFLGPPPAGRAHDGDHEHD